jgi:hypothetical protein
MLSKELQEGDIGWSFSFRVGRGVLVGIPERKRPICTPRSRWEDNIKLDLR